VRLHRGWLTDTQTPKTVHVLYRSLLLVLGRCLSHTPKRRRGQGHDRTIRCVGTLTSAASFSPRRKHSNCRQSATGSQALAVAPWLSAPPAPRRPDAAGRAVPARPPRGAGGVRLDRQRRRSGQRNPAPRRRSVRGGGRSRRPRKALNPPTRRREGCGRRKAAEFVQLASAPKPTSSPARARVPERRLRGADLCGHLAVVQVVPRGSSAFTNGDTWTGTSISRAPSLALWGRAHSSIARHHRCATGRAGLQRRVRRKISATRLELTRSGSESSSQPSVEWSNILVLQAGVTVMSRALFQAVDYPCVRRLQRPDQGPNAPRERGVVVPAVRFDEPRA
jgi:hypothetical protein